MEEVFDIYTRDGKYLWTASKADCHSENPGFYHKPVWIRIINSKNEILVQKRAACKKIIPISDVCELLVMFLLEKL